MTRNPKTLIIGSLFAIGLLSFFWQIWSEENVTIGSAFVSLGIEGLKTAILFVLLDYIIARSDKRRSDYDDALLRLRIGDWTSESEIDYLLDKIDVDGKISVDLSRGANFQYTQFRLSNRHVDSSHWFGSLMPGAQFDGCYFSSVRLDSVDLRKAIINDTTFRDCIFDNVDFSDAVFLRCKFENVRAANLVVERITITDCEGSDVLTAK